MSIWEESWSYDPLLKEGWIQPGVDHSTGGKPIELWLEQERDGEKYIVLKVPGGKYWSGRGQQAYSGGHYRVMKVIREVQGMKVGIRHLRLLKLFEIPLSGRPK